MVRHRGLAVGRPEQDRQRELCRSGVAVPQPKPFGECRAPAALRRPAASRVDAPSLASDAEVDVWAADPDRIVYHHSIMMMCFLPQKRLTYRTARIASGRRVHAKLSALQPCSPRGRWSLRCSSTVSGAISRPSPGCIRTSASRSRAIWWCLSPRRRRFRAPLSCPCRPRCRRCPSDCESESRECESESGRAFSLPNPLIQRRFLPFSKPPLIAFD